MISKDSVWLWRVLLVFNLLIVCFILALELAPELIWYPDDYESEWALWDVIDTVISMLSILALYGLSFRVRLFVYPVWIALLIYNMISIIVWPTIIVLQELLAGNDLFGDGMFGVVFLAFMYIYGGLLSLGLYQYANYVKIR